MMILLNGAFGVGKSSAAEIVAQALPDAMLFDPEDVGAMVRKITQGVRVGEEDSGDYQDIALWRSLTVDIAGELRRRYRRTLVIPMTFARLDYLREVRHGLSLADADVRHFCLTASGETIRERLKKRGVPDDSWAHRQTARCLRAFESEEFEEFVTERRSAREVADVVLSRLPSP